MALTHEDVVSILKIIDESPYDEVRLEIGDLKLYVSRHGTGPGAAGAPPMPQTLEPPVRSLGSEVPAQTAPKQIAPQEHRLPGQTGAAEAQVREGLVAVRAPMLGTFYRSPSPGEPPFVEVGSKVKSDDIVCLVEVMKLFNSVKAGVTGTVVKIDCDNGSMVEHGQVLILIEADQQPVETVMQ
jgi:acetyl-CoA carboxylase biotin carboxyl carrier protein